MDSFVLGSISYLWPEITTISLNCLRMDRNMGSVVEEQDEGGSKKGEGLLQWTAAELYNY